MFELLAWLVCLLLLLIFWAFSSTPPPRVRPLTTNEKWAWRLYRIEDKAAVARLRFDREHARHRWDLNRQHAEAIRVWRRVLITPRPTGPNEK